ncbi:MAG: hypothetical protein HQM13_03310 [SAR324 cluster bacterium]|nr:hypothetical protein [SAR324 cluster bacterium]
MVKFDQFPKFPSDSFKSQREENEYLYNLLDFTLHLDAIEDENPHLIEFVENLLELVAPLLEVDEIALILKDHYLNSWMPLISIPRGETIHNSLDFKTILQVAESVFESQESAVFPLQSINGGLLAYPLVFKNQSIGVLFLFEYHAENDQGEERSGEAALPELFCSSSDRYSKMMKMLWYINELENDAIRDRLELWETQSILGKYISSQVMEKIIQSPVPIDFEGQEVEVSILFADLCDFTRIAESLPSKQVVGLLNTIWSTLVEIAFKYQGTVDKFMGDCIMVVYNSPMPQKDHYFCACATALEFQEGIRRIKQDPQWASFDLALSIGINTGPATCGNIGSKDRLEYTVIGDSVNLAARLEESASPGEILISANVFEKIEGGFWTRKKELRQFKGKSELVQTYQLEGHYTQSDLETEFLNHPPSFQKNVLTNIAFSNSLLCAKTLCRFLPKCNKEVALQIFALFEKYFSVEVLPELTLYLQSTDDPYLVSKCVKTVGFLGGPPYLEYLLPFLEHHDIRVLANTIEAIGLTGSKDTFQLVQPFLAHENHRVLLRACQVCWDENRNLILDQFVKSLLSPSTVKQRAVLVMLNESTLNEIMFSFWHRYSSLADENRQKIRAIIIHFGSKKLQRYLNVTEEKIAHHPRQQDFP